MMMDQSDDQVGRRDPPSKLVSDYDALAMTVNRSQWRLTGCAKQNIPGPTATCRRNRQRTRGLSEPCETSAYVCQNHRLEEFKQVARGVNSSYRPQQRTPKPWLRLCKRIFPSLVPTLSSLCTTVHAACSMPASLPAAFGRCAQKLRSPHIIATPAVLHIRISYAIEQ